MATFLKNFTEIKAVGMDGGWSGATANGLRTFTLSGDGQASVVWRDGSTAQQHPNLKSGSRIVFDPVNKTVEIVEVL